MKLETEDFIYLCEFAIDAAKAAGKHISQKSTEEIVVNHKEEMETYASQVVTEVDLQCQDIILEYLKPTIEKFDLAVLTEETEDSGERLVKDYFWCIDPLDGTLPFIEKTHGYSVSIALNSKSGEPKLGVIYDPLKHKLYHAIAGVGAFRNEEMWFLKEPKSRDTLKWITDRSLQSDPRFDALNAEMVNYADSNGQKLEIITIGGGALNACWVIEQAPAVYYKLPKKSNGGGSLWDYSASACIHENISGNVSDIFGKPLELNREESTYLNHSGVLYASDPSLASDMKVICQRVYAQHEG